MIILQTSRKTLCFKKEKEGTKGVLEREFRFASFQASQKSPEKEENVSKITIN